MGDNKFLDLDTYYLGHPDVKINKSFETMLMFNRSKGQLMYGIENIINNNLMEKRTYTDLMEAARYATGWGLDYPLEMFQKVVGECNGYMPLSIRGLKSGMFAPKGTPFLQIKNTLVDTGPLAAWCEAILMHASFDSACLTRAHEMAVYLRTNNLPANRIHSFGYRGHRSMEDAKKAGIAWFIGGLKGSDDFHIAQWLPEDIGAGSIPALAHTAVQNFGVENEMLAYMTFINTNVKKGYKVMAIVIDTYSSENFIRKYLETLMEIANEEGITIVYRPDSGDVLAYTKMIYERARKRERTDCTKVIIGESVTFEKIKEWDAIFDDIGIPKSFVFFGIGAGYYNDLNRDTHGWAMKTCHIVAKDLNDRIPVMKFSDTPIKMSIPGPVDLINTEKGMTVILEEEDGDSLYETLYYYHPDEMNGPEIYYPHIPEIYERVLNQNTMQREIYYSDKLIALKDDLIKKWNANIG